MGTIVQFRLPVLDSLKYSSKTESPINKSTKAVISRNLTTSRHNHLSIYLFFYLFICLFINYLFVLFYFILFYFFSVFFKFFILFFIYLQKAVISVLSA